MNKTVFTHIKELLVPQLDMESSTGTLSDSEHEVIYALLQVLADDESCDPAACRKFVSVRTETRPGLLKEYQDAVLLLSKQCQSKFGAKQFPQLTLTERNQVLKKVLLRYQHPLNSKRWQQKGRLTGENLDVVFGKLTRRKFRQFVIRDLLLHYYTGTAGWSVVGYSDFPGHIRYEDEPCDVIGFTVDGESVMLQLSDGTFERLDPETLRLDDERGLRAVAKSGRQQITFERNTYYSFCELLEETDDGFVLKLGDKVYELSDNA